MLKLRAARIDELAALSALCLRSKAVWGYDRAFLEACRAELTLSPLTLANVQVAESDGNVVGVAEISVEGGIAHLEKLFVEPAHLKSGAGRVLFAWAKVEAAGRGAKALVIESDPDAAPFYRRLGARDDGVVPSGSIPGRFLPRLVLDL